MAEKEKQLRFETIGVHGGLKPDPVTGARAVPIYQNNAYQFQNTEHAQDLFGLKETGYIYSRIHNPTVTVFEERVALLEGGTGALALASGQAAIYLALLNIVQAGDEIVAASNLYGGTYNLFTVTLPKYGINVRLIDINNEEELRAAINEKTRAVFAETIGNPSLQVLDIETVSNIAHEHGVPLVVDNTFATPYLCRPIEHGADIVVHSATKWLLGNGTTMGGIIVDGGKFDWNSEKYPGLSQPDTSYNDIVYSEALGPVAYITKARVQLLRDLGPALSAQSAFQFTLGLETLTVRMKEHIANTKKIVQYLNNHPAVNWVLYPGDDNHPNKELADKYLSKGAGAVVVFGISGGREAGAKVINSVELFAHVANVGDAKSLIIHPASTTHQQLNQDGLKQAGVPEDLIRLSIGIENVEDLIDDLESAIEAATGIASLNIRV
ncbi:MULTISPECIES: O-acetylhomoserine aminocarboxypropyltransferase/cysteine synthase family protein [Cytobacillus]|uniref:O-acetylhomoserine aminocarboxypropyltransferase n=1 Tax=Cytobacillus kochii TaxID=859143 RepID=A0A248TK04_9BACI|nr:MULTISPECIES: O-acetylhomoserine aminocarboxypropyltransferase/cysteine synthase family protein [Cytobacillus]ASV68420.1 O-acetylhomoserine aminocarboxypropyltransferase [Cytobacillus kochii]MDQ0187530.1 O-acetylhomoserine (thiol)-lyase [Cytobacillus kochii]MEA1855373.1 O-acetylhomoserine aminocarboxypropyltransferase/cysteine synthase family protein [Cytobacillus sp. OWB-43]MED1606360.1 O-acetylhomoserine aminocarboxypropyltransferase/cysteine synthase [Cytobacillus kochii]